MEKMRHNVEDVNKWKGKLDFKEKFSTHETWLQLRENYGQCHWAKGVKATPKFAFITWLALLNRHTTMDRVAKWSVGVDTICVLCKNVGEIRNHLFFECVYSSQLWEHLTLEILRSANSNVWADIVSLITDNSRRVMSTFYVRHSFQAVVYAI